MHTTQSHHLGLMPGPPPVDPITTAIFIGINVVGLYSAFKEWMARGELKIAATAKAEEYVESIWGTKEPNSPPVADSVAKLIEACDLHAAQEMIFFLGRQMQEKASTDEYFKRWVVEWGKVTITQIQSKLDAYRGYCLASSEPEPGEPAPVSCPPDFQLAGGKCIPIACPPGFFLSGGRCITLSPATLPPAIDETTGQYVPLPQATLTKTGMFGILAAALAIIVISR